MLQVSILCRLFISRTLSTSRPLSLQELAYWIFWVGVKITRYGKFGLSPTSCLSNFLTGYLKMSILWLNIVRCFHRPRGNFLGKSSSEPMTETRLPRATPEKPALQATKEHAERGDCIYRRRENIRHVAETWRHSPIGQRWVCTGPDWLAEGARFELAVELPPLRFSRPLGKTERSIEDVQWRGFTHRLKRRPSCDVAWSCIQCGLGEARWLRK